MPRTLSRLALAWAAMVVPLRPVAGQWGESASAGTKQFGTYHALLIAVQDYPHLPHADTLRYPISDAIRLQDVLVDRYNFDQSNITLLQNPDHDAILLAFLELSRDLGPTDNLLVFFAGHGSWDATNGLGYWLPSDAEPDNDLKWISNGEIASRLQRIKTHHTLLVTDACFGGSILVVSPFGATGPAADSKAWLERRSRRAITSGALEPVPDQSTFIQVMIKELQQNETSPLSATSLFALLAAGAVRSGRTIPMNGVVNGAGDTGGDFPFALAEGAAEPVDRAEREYVEGPKRIFQHILIRIEGSAPADSLRALAQAARVRQALAVGMTFAEAARRYSADTLSAGEWGFIPPMRKRGRLPAEFEGPAWRLEVGELSDVVVTRAGLHLVRRPTYAEALQYDSLFVPSGEGTSITSSPRDAYLELRGDHLAAVLSGRDSEWRPDPLHEADAAEHVGVGPHTAGLRRAMTAAQNGDLSAAVADYRAVLAQTRKGELTPVELLYIKAELGLLQLRRAEAAPKSEAAGLATEAAGLFEEVIAARGLLAIQVVEPLQRARRLAGKAPVRASEPEFQD